MLNNKSILITGGTGSFGTAFLEHCLSIYKNIKRIVVFSRDELKQYNLSKRFSKEKFPCLRYFRRLPFRYVYSWCGSGFCSENNRQ
jgi:FlaA1/EpsC-like NDP-sugar epimerase